MAKRDNNYSLTINRNDYKIPVDVEETLDFLEKNGKLPPKKVLLPQLVNTRCMIYYKEIIEYNLKINNDEYIKDIDELRQKKSLVQEKVINLVSIIIGSVIKRFKTLYPTYYSDVFTECVMDILLKINKNHYDPTKSSFHSYCYETSYQSCIKYLNNKATYENSIVCLVQD